MILDLRQIFQNSLILSASNGLGFIISFVSMLVLIRNIGLDGYGMTASVAASALIGKVVIDWGFQISAVTEFCQTSSRGQKKSLIAEVAYARVFLALLLSITLYCTYNFFLQIFVDEKAVYGTILYWFSQAIFPTWLFLSIRTVLALSVIQLISKLFILMFIIMFVNDKSEFWKLIWVDGIALLTCFGIYTVFWRRYDLLGFKNLAFVSVIGRLRNNLGVFMSVLSQSTTGAMVVLVISFLIGSQASGIFAMSDRIVQFLNRIWQPISEAILPFIAGSSGISKRFIYNTTMLILCFSTILFLVIFFEANSIASMVTGEKNEILSEVLIYFSVGIALSPLKTFFGVHVLLPLGYQRIYSVIIALETLLILMSAIALANYGAWQYIPVSFSLAWLGTTCLFAKLCLAGIEKGGSNATAKSN